MQFCPGGGQLAGLASFERLGEDGIAVIVVEDHNVDSHERIGPGICRFDRSTIF